MSIKGQLMLIKRRGNKNKIKKSCLFGEMLKKKLCVVDDILSSITRQR